jgi:hypothetical protein
MIRALLTLAMITALPSCLIMPHYETLTGKFSGSLVDSKNCPIQGAKVEYLYNSHRLLGNAKTNACGQFKLGPFRQWFYLLYIGSPGVCPFPYALDSFRDYPDALKVTTGKGSSIFLVGSKDELEARISPSHRKHITLPRSLRWTGSCPVPKLALRSKENESFVPTVKLSTGILKP